MVKNDLMCLQLKSLSGFFFVFLVSGGSLYTNCKDKMFGSKVGIKLNRLEP